MPSRTRDQDRVRSLRRADAGGRRDHDPRGQARAAEVVGFGLLVAWFVRNEYVHLIAWAEEQNHSAVLFTLASEVLAFYVVMSGYAMFIPNTWRRALLIVGGMAVVPFAMLGAVRVTNPEEYRIVAASLNLNNLSFLTVVMAAGHLLQRQMSEWGYRSDIIAPLSARSPVTCGIFPLSSSWRVG